MKAAVRHGESTLKLERGQERRYKRAKSSANKRAYERETYAKDFATRSEAEERSAPAD